MDNKTLFVFIVLSTRLFLSYSSVLPPTKTSAAMTQSAALGRLQKEKFKKSNSREIENRFFDQSEELVFEDDTLLVDQDNYKLSDEQKEKDKIESLPGQPNVSFHQYGGYITVDQKAGRAFYYYLAEAQKSPSTSPLLLWLNGGPGCSSLGYGAMEELGPFRVKSDGKTLYLNDYAWNQVANVLFLESPAGVGFSYSNTTNDTVFGGDKQTSIDNYAFLVNWLERFPEYKDRDFYISGESYAGHYVPQLAQTILHQNKNKAKIVKLKGIIIGNAVIEDETELIGEWSYYGSHAIYSDVLVSQVLKYCNFTPGDENQTDVCNKAADAAYNSSSNINIYNIYAPLCFDSNLTVEPKKTSLFEYDPCSDNYVSAYLNRRDVQDALHANVTNIPYAWDFCGNINWTDSPTTVLPLLKEFMDSGLRVWIYSGDVDARVPVTSTLLGLEKMELQTTNAWRPWYLSEEVGGYTEEYAGNLTFATVRGAGHEVPSYQPQRALSLISNFLAGKRLPDLTAK